MFDCVCDPSVSSKESRFVLVFGVPFVFLPAFIAIVATLFVTFILVLINVSLKFLFLLYAIVGFFGNWVVKTVFFSIISQFNISAFLMSSVFMYGLYSFFVLHLFC